MDVPYYEPLNNATLESWLGGVIDIIGEIDPAAVIRNIYSYGGVQNGGETELVVVVVSSQVIGNVEIWIRLDDFTVFRDRLGEARRDLIETLLDGLGREEDGRVFVLNQYQSMERFAEFLKRNPV